MVAELGHAPFFLFWQFADVHISSSWPKMVLTMILMRRYPSCLNISWTSLQLLKCVGKNSSSRFRSKILEVSPSLLMYMYVFGLVYSCSAKVSVTSLACKLDKDHHQSLGNLQKWRENLLYEGDHRQQRPEWHGLLELRRLRGFRDTRKDHWIITLLRRHGQKEILSDLKN